MLCMGQVLVGSPELTSSVTRYGVILCSFPIVNFDVQMYGTLIKCLNIVTWLEVMYNHRVKWSGCVLAGFIPLSSNMDFFFSF